MSRDSEALIDIQQAALRIMRFTENISRAELEANEEKISAILDQIAIIERPKDFLATFAKRIHSFHGENLPGCEIL